MQNLIKASIIFFYKRISLLVSFGNIVISMCHIRSIVIPRERIPFLRDFWWFYFEPAYTMPIIMSRDVEARGTVFRGRVGVVSSENRRVIRQWLSTYKQG